MSYPSTALIQPSGGGLKIFLQAYCRPLKPLQTQLTHVSCKGVGELLSLPDHGQEGFLAGVHGARLLEEPRIDTVEHELALDASSTMASCCVLRVSREDSSRDGS
jgi:hypothetical protein